MKDKLKHLLFVLLILIIFPITTYADSSKAWKNEIPRDKYHDSFDYNKRTAVVSCVYHNAIGSCTKDSKQEINSCGVHDFNVQDYVGEKDMRIVVIYYDKISYNATGAFKHADNYFMCVDGKMDKKPYCYSIDETQSKMRKFESEYSGYLYKINLENGYVPYQFTEKEFMEKIDDNASCPDIWKKCDGNGWSKFYLSDPGDGTLLKKTSSIKKYDLDAPDLVISTCSTLFGSPKNPNAPAYFLSFAFKVVRFVAIILLIVLSALDFLQASAAQDTDAIKKSFTKTMKRMLLCILIFVLPILLEFVLSIVNEKEVDLCISTSNEEGYVAVDDTNTSE